MLLGTAVQAGELGGALLYGTTQGFQTLGELGILREEAILGEGYFRL